MASIISAGTTSNTALNLSADTTGVLQFQTNGTTPAMTITTGQLVGIGTSSPTARLHVSGGQIIVNTTDNTSNIYLQNSGTTYLQLRGNTTSAFLNNPSAGPMVFGTSDTERMRIDSSGLVGIGLTPTDPVGFTRALNIGSTTGGGLYLSDSANPTTSYMYLGYIASSGVSYLWSLANAAMLFGTNNSERMRITSGGSLLIGQTADNAKVCITFTGGASQNGLRLNTADAGTSTAVQFVYNAVNQVGTITTTTAATAYNTTSDYRLKENIVPITGALAKVAQLKPVTYNWKVDGSTGQGFIAHELQEVVPDCVTGEKDAVDEEGNPVYQGIDTSFLVATLTAAIQEQQAMIEELKQEVAALKAK